MARRKNRDNVFITYLNVNSLRYKFIELGDILYDKLSDICFFAETKLDDTFNQQNFNVPGRCKITPPNVIFGFDTFYGVIFMCTFCSKF